MRDDMLDMQPIDIPTAETHRFVAACAPPGSRVLEVGCGAGHLAVALGRAGFDVVAIDASERAVERARGQGVDAVHADWLTYDDDPFDAIIFTRSLHHIFPLDAAVEHTRRLLGDGGCVLADEFACEDFDEPTAAWLTGHAARLHERGMLDGDVDNLPCAMLAGDDPIATWTAWHGGHQHELHRADEIEQSLAAHGFDVSVETVPYLYRYFAECLRDADAMLALMTAETEVIRAGMVRPIGRRFAARDIP